MRSRLAPFALLWILALSGVAVAQRDGVMTVDIDATDLPRKLLEAKVGVPVSSDISRSGGELALWYPKWIPGIHGPGGPVQNLAGLIVTDGAGQRLAWSREPGDVNRINVTVPRGLRSVSLELRYITNQPSTNSRGVDSFGSELLGFISPNTVLFYPDGARAADTMVRASLTLPDDWQAVTALKERKGSTAEVDRDEKPGRVEYDVTDLSTFVDSPIMVGRHVRAYDLVVEDVAETTPPHLMSVFSEAESVIDLPDDMVELFENMVTQGALLFGSFPFESMDIMVATTDSLGRNGLEHLSSTFNVIPQRSLQSVKRFKGWDEYLIPHEYVHAWVGKYRRPAGMDTPDFHTPKGTELLWVYEGLTQHLGVILNVRSGFTSEEEYEWSLQRSVRNFRLRQGRDWRPLIDTCAASHTLRGGSESWSHLRRSQDYYGEGALIWLEVDAVMRRLSRDETNLDEFSRRFFEHRPDEPNPRSFTRADVIEELSGLVQHDWEAFFRERLDEPGPRLATQVAKELGYLVQFTNELPEGPDDSKYDELDLRDSIGASFRGSGEVRSVQLGSPADAAGLGPGMKVIGIGDFVWTKERLIDEIERSPETGRLDLLVASGEKLVKKPVIYDGGPRFMVLKKKSGEPDRLGEILKPRKVE
ncbi:MAG: hypothetical protein AAF533_13710 [Acidobacteriota bacterium]